MLSGWSGRLVGLWGGLKSAYKARALARRERTSVSFDGHGRRQPQAIFSLVPVVLASDASIAHELLVVGLDHDAFARALFGRLDDILD